MIYFVGAGPGAPDLITVRGQKLLEQADVIIYAGSLVNQDLLRAAKAGCGFYNSACMTLEEVISVMEEAAQAGKLCVRLHTGDPSLYGAVREQMAELDRRGITYASCPGVSAMFGAAAERNLEYTLPGVSQTVIVSRAAGRTPVPERESIRHLARHGATMVLYLSAGQMEQVTQELLAGGYPPDTPALIACRATWPDQRYLPCTAESLAQTAKRNGISRTALVLVGNVLDGAFERSKLYDPAFSTGYRPAQKKETETAGRRITERDRSAAVIAFTKEGEQLACRIAGFLGEAGWICEAFTGRQEATGEKAPGEKAACSGHLQILQGSLREWTGMHFADSRALLFIGAAGIAVRAIAPFVRDKMYDPAVIVIDEAARHVVPLLSGHMGGANRLARKLAGLLGADCVLTTATDVRNLFAVDSFAAENGLCITDREKAKQISAAVLAGKRIGIRAPAGWLREEDLPEKLVLWKGGELTAGQMLQEGGQSQEEPARAEGGEPFGGLVEVDWRRPLAGERAFVLIPEKALWIGAGCKKGTEKAALEKAFARFLKEQKIDRRALAGMASISLKSREEGLLQFAGDQKLPIHFYEASQLEALEGAFSDSDFVKEQTGTGNVCERAACLAAMEAGSGRDSAADLLVIKKQKYDGITFAAALADRRLHFE